MPIKRTPKMATRAASGDSGNAILAQTIVELLSDGVEWNVAQIKEAAIERRVAGFAPETPPRRLNGIMLGLLAKKRVVSVGGGRWQLAQHGNAAEKSAQMVHESVQGSLV